VRLQNSVLFRSPRQERFVIDTRQAEILRANDIDRGILAE
jgi:hypothetical protein